jgi:hypothetical protein
MREVAVSNMASNEFVLKAFAEMKEDFFEKSPTRNPEIVELQKKPLFDLSHIMLSGFFM